MLDRLLDSGPYLFVVPAQAGTWKGLMSLDRLSFMDLHGLSFILVQTPSSEGAALLDSGMHRKDGETTGFRHAPE